MLDQPLLLEPLLRLMPLPHTLVRHASVSVERRLRTLQLADTPLAKSAGGHFDDSCRLTIAADMEPDQLPLKLTATKTRHTYSGVHLTILSTKGQYSVTVGDDYCRLFVGSGTVIRGRIQLNEGATAFIGDSTMIGSSQLFVGNADLVIGEDCHLLGETILQCNDPHPLTDLRTGELLNGQRQRMYIGRHVLINRRAMLLPGVRLGDGAIVVAGAVVSSDVPPNTMVGGVPAVVLREQVGWSRETSRARVDLPLVRQIG